MSAGVAAPVNRHCCVVEIGGTGVMIEGPSGAGKTSLALGLVDAAARRGIPAHFVADDQALVERRGDGVTASVAQTIAGLAEIRGHGIVSVAHKPSCAIALVARLVADEAVGRMPIDKTAVIEGIELPLVEVPVRHEAQAVRIVLASLRISVV
ncbi:MAG TPA: HPr kinase/phosphorylase [Rhizobiaceae bacterium]|nr:HPr kinase/phosphorylase [Rhizobiaceae bacterium]